MRISKQLCFLVAAAISSAVNGVPVGNLLQRRQEIMLELTPTQKVDVDGSREVPTILISEYGPQSAPFECLGQQCGTGTTSFQPLRGYKDPMGSQLSYDPQYENYARPSPTYPTSRIMTAPPAPMQQQPSYPVSSSPVADVASPPTAGPVLAPNAGWLAPLIPGGVFQPAVNGPLLPASKTTTALSPVAGGVPNPTTSSAGQIPPPSPPPAAPVPGVVAATAGSPPATLPTPDPNPPAQSSANSKDPNKESVAKPDAVIPLPSMSTDTQKNGTEQGNAQGTPENKDNKDAPKLPRSLRPAKSQNSPHDTLKKRSTGAQRLRKRQLMQTEKADGLDYPSTVQETKEVLIPVTDSELSQLQEGTSELISYPIVEEGGVEGQTVYDVIPKTISPEPLETSFKDILEKGAEKMSMEREGRSTIHGFEKRSEDEALDGFKYVPEANVNWEDLHKRLKHDSNGFNSSIVKNGIGKEKYGYAIHDNNGASSLSSIGLVATMTVTALLGIWTTL